MTFEQAMRLAGLLPRDIVADGKWRRCATEDHPRTRNGAYKLSVDGLRGWFKNWATDDGMNVWQGEDTRTAAKRAADDKRQQALAEQERAYRQRSLARMRVYWGDSTPLTQQHPYLADKGLSLVGCGALRTNDEMLVVPVLLKGKLINLQKIPPEGSPKKFWPAAPMEAGSLVLDRPRASVTCIAEGLATGLAVFQSIPHARVIVAFNAGNLLPAAEAIGLRGSALICADNDHETEARRGFNPGIQQAQKAADALGCGVAYPTDIEGSDWADALKEWGNRAATRVQREILKEARLVMT